MGLEFFLGLYNSTIAGTLTFARLLLLYEKPAEPIKHLTRFGGFELQLEGIRRELARLPLPF